MIHLDVKTAFLNGKIDRLKYITLPPGVEGNRKTTVCKLNKALYGLATAPKCWYMTFNSFILLHGFIGSVREPCLYTKKVGDNILILLLYVDDILLACKNCNLIDKTVTLLSKEFEIVNLGFPTRFLGIEISLDYDLNISLTQTTILDSILKKYQMDESKPVSTPIVCDSEYENLKHTRLADYSYRSAIGSLMHLANYTRPDIAFAVHYLARYQQKPEPIHFVMVKRIFRYLNGTSTCSLKFDKNSSTVLESYVDASYKDDPKTARSTTGYVIMYHGNLIGWRSRLQRIQVKSTTQAEYIAICDASDDILFLARLIEETLELKNVFPVTTFEDKEACISQCENTATRGKLKFIEKKLLEK